MKRPMKVCLYNSDDPRWNVGQRIRNATGTCPPELSDEIFKLLMKSRVRFRPTGALSICV